MSTSLTLSSSKKNNCKPVNTTRATFQFKPKEAESYNTLLTLDQLEIGRSYELVVTTLSGLYRYKTLKTFLVVGRHHDTPTVIIDKG